MIWWFFSQGILAKRFECNWLKLCQRLQDGLAPGQGNLGLRQNGDLWKGTIIKVESVGFFLMRGKQVGSPAGRTR